ncbi:hypothetical protein FE634_21910 [Nocardioides dongxiaopingii]|uniref:hypothetical protein n=1 Tax=Nocardioides sp. S-1144 TaxID=2582905 RepID=UPI001164315E|nr:hypothetical protein [Nocardioides sp. S-1144]QDH11033.1 hypothetical protein FE634_21910 [Nocardioides sp. S-1144]
MRRREEQGAIAIIGAAVMVVVLGVAAFVVDLGLQRVARQDVQALVDVVALDLARMLDGDRTAGDLRTVSPTLDDATAASLARNDDDVVGAADTLEVVPTLLVADDAGQGGGTPVWREARPDESPEAVRVVASIDVPFGFAAVADVRSGRVERSATAGAESSACFHVGSFAAAVERADAAIPATLNDLLGQSLSAEDYRVLAREDVALDDVAEALPAGLASFDDQVRVRDLLRAVAAAVPAGSGARGVLARAADAVATSAAARVADVVKVSVDDRLALDNPTPVLDLVAPLLFASLGPQPSSVPAGGGFDAAVEVTGVPGVQRVCAAEEARGAEVRATFSGAVELFADQPVRRRDLGVVDVEVEAAVAVGGAALTMSGGVECRDVEDGEDRLVVAAADGLGTSAVSATVRVVGTISPLPPGVEEVTVDVEIDLVAPAPPGVGPSSVDLLVPTNAVRRGAPSSPGTTGEPFTALAGLPAIRRADLGPDTDGVVVDAPNRPGRAARVLRDLRRDLNQAIDTQVDAGAVTTVGSEVARLAVLLGARRGGADLYGEDRPTCTGVRLTG